MLTDCKLLFLLKTPCSRQHLYLRCPLGDGCVLNESMPWERHLALPAPDHQEVRASVVHKEDVG